MNYNIGCGPHLAPSPWVNLDCISNDIIHPDIVVDDPMYPLAKFNDAERVYCGHLLEHIQWEHVDSFVRGIHQSMSDGAQLMVVGPDVKRAIKQWHGGLQDWDTVVASMEGASAFYEDHYVAPLWMGARHQWNCTEDRLIYLLEPIFSKIEPLPIQSSFLDDWPVVSRATWQCVVRCTK